jgi:hypothetical protein
MGFRRLLALVVLASPSVWSLSACNLIIGGEDKVLVEAEDGEGGSGGDGGGVTAGTGGAGGTEVIGGAAGAAGAAAAGGAGAGGEAGASGAAGSGGGGTAGAGGLGGTAGTAGTGGTAGAGAGTGGAPGGSAGAAGSGGMVSPPITAPGTIDCEVSPTLGTHRFCTDFSPTVSGWENVGCKSLVAEGTNTIWQWQQDAGKICNPSALINLGGTYTTATAEMWLRLDQLALGDDSLPLLRLRLGPEGSPEGFLGVHVDRDGAGKVTGTSVVLDAGPKAGTIVIGAIPQATWRHVRLSVAATGALHAEVGSTTTDVLGSGDRTVDPGAAGSPQVEIRFLQTEAGVGLTKVSIDELTVDVTTK